MKQCDEAYPTKRVTKRGDEVSVRSEATLCRSTSSHTSSFTLRRFRLPVRTGATIIFSGWMLMPLQVAPVRQGGDFGGRQFAVKCQEIVVTLVFLPTGGAAYGRMDSDGMGGCDQPV